MSKSTFKAVTSESLRRTLSAFQLAYLTSGDKRKALALPTGTLGPSLSRAGGQIYYSVLSSSVYVLVLTLLRTLA